MGIDFVYTWVDGGDPAWAVRRCEAMRVAGLLDDDAACCAARFSDNGELKYSLRSINKYAPWVRHIYLVTDRQVPKWLALEHPKVRVVDHRDIFEGGDVLPTFNGRAIESRLHNIPGLSEHFVYFNDDMFLGRAAQPWHFFGRHGLPRVYTESRTAMSVAPWELGRAVIPGDRDVLHGQAVVNSRLAVQRVTGRLVAFNLRHQAKPMLKSMLKEMAIGLYRAEFDNVARAPFRATDQVCPTYLYGFHALATGRAVKTYLKSFRNRRRPLDFLYSHQRSVSSMYLETSGEIKARLERLRDARPLFFCVNQSPRSDESSIAHSLNFLSQYFSEQAPFER